MPAETKEEAVANGARIFESVENKLEKAHAQMLQMLAVIEDGRRLGMIPSALLYGRLKGEVMAIAGIIGESYKRTMVHHRELTDIAITNNVDVPQTRDGGSR